MKASLRSVRIAPKKAQLVAKLIRGKSVPDAVSILEHTNKKAARLLEDLLRSAMANSSHNVQQDPQLMIIKEVVVNKAQAYHRGVPMARGRVRPMKKFLSHIEISLGFEEEKGQKPAKKETKKSEAKTSKPAEKPVQKETTAAKKSSTTSTAGKSTTKETTSKTSKSATSKKSSSSSKK